MARAAWEEELELRELNARLGLYVSRVRALEEENRRLAQELAALRGRDQRLSPELRAREAAVAELRRRVAELSLARGEAELERDAMRREAAQLEALGAQCAELRLRRLEPELEAQWRQLERLRADCAALEALLEALGQDRGQLEAALREDREQLLLAAQRAPLPPPTRGLPRRALEEPLELVLSWSCARTLDRYQAELGALQELEGRIGREDLRQLRAQNEESRRRLEELHLRCQDLAALTERLEQERVAQEEQQGVALAEYQMIIDSLEEEKHFLTVSIAEYLKDYHDLLQVKAGLSLEIATYRALLEGESSEWILMWDEQHGRKLPQSVRDMLYEYSCHHSAYQQEKGKRTFPPIQYVDAQYKSPRTNINSFAVYSSQTKNERKQTVGPGKTLRRDIFTPEYHPSSIKKDVSHVRVSTEQREARNFSSPYLISPKSKSQWGTVPERSRREGGSTVSFSKESVTVQKEASPSENARKGDAPAFSSYNLRAASNETQDERPLGRTRGANEKTGDYKVVEKETIVLKEGRKAKERLTKERTPSDVEEVSEKSAETRRRANVEHRTEIKQDTDERKHTVENLSIERDRKYDKFIEHKTPEGGNYIGWEEHSRMGVSEKSLPGNTKVEDSYSFKKKNGSVTTQSKETAEIPAHSEVYGREHILKIDNKEVTLQDVKSTVENQKYESTFRPTGKPNQEGGSEETSSKMDTFLTESIAENIVSDILKDFVPKSSDAGQPTAVFEKKDVSEDGKVKTENNIQGTVPGHSEFDDFDLVSFLKRDAKNVLEECKGTLPKHVIEDTFEASMEGVRGKEKGSVKVEIAEKPLEDHKGTLPKHVIEDTFEANMEGVRGKEKGSVKVEIAEEPLEDHKGTLPKHVIEDTLEASMEGVGGKEKGSVKVEIAEEPLEDHKGTLPKHVIEDTFEASMEGVGGKEKHSVKVETMKEPLEGHKGTLPKHVVEDTFEATMEVMGGKEKHSVKVKDVEEPLEDHKGTLPKHIVEDTFEEGVRSKEKCFVKFEIVEEPLGSTADERVDFSTPFEVEEAEDTFPGMAGHPDYRDEGKTSRSATKDFKEKQPSVVVTHVEEVTEGDDVVDEGKYFVSTPDEHPMGHEQDKNSIYGQIYIEEESTVKYSWQDEFLQGPQTTIKKGLGSPEVVYEVLGGERGAYISKEETPKEQVARAESIVIEKDIKIPHEFQDSIKGLLSSESKDPKRQLKEALEKIEDTLPESVKQELSALTKESEAESSTVEVDIRKMERDKEGGLVTIVAEVNLSQTLDPDQFNMEFLGEGVADQVKLLTQSASEESLEEHKKQGSESHVSGGNKIRVDVSSTPWTVEEVSSSVKLRGSDDTKQSEVPNEQVIYQGSVFKSTEASSGEDKHPAQMSFDINRRIKQIVIGPTEVHETEHVHYEGPVAESFQFGWDDFGRGASTEEIIFKGPVHKTVEVSESESAAQTQFLTDIRSSKHITRGSKQIVEEVIFEGPASDLPSNNDNDIFLQRKGPVETSRSIKHIRIDPKEVHSEHIVYKGPLPGPVELQSTGDHVVTEESVKQIRIGEQKSRILEQSVYEESSTETTGSILKDGVSSSNASFRHIKLGPKEFMTEQMIFTQPTSEQHLEFSELRQDFPAGSVKHIRLGQSEVQSGERVVYHSSVSESSATSSSRRDILEERSPLEISRTTRHIQLNSGETLAEQIVFHGPVSETAWRSTTEPSLTGGPSESSPPIGHIKIGPKDTSFTFQMDVTNAAGRDQGATIIIPGKRKVDAGSLEGAVKDGQKVTKTEQASEEVTFDQRVQLQRMVDQRSVISDEKKIALLYLNQDEDQEEDDDGPWF